MFNKLAVDLLKRCLDLETKSGKFVKENKGMIPMLSITTLAWQEVILDFQTLLRELISDDLHSKRAMNDFYDTQGSFICPLARFLIVFIHC